MRGKDGTSRARSKIRLVLFIGTLGGGGAQRHVSLLAPRLDRGRFDVTVCCRKKTGEYLSEVEAAGIEVLEFGSHGKLFGPSALQADYRLARFLESRSVDILHSFLFECNIQGIMAAKLCPGVRVIAGLRNMDDKYGSFRHAVYVRVLKRSDGIVAVCPAVKARYVSRGLPEHLISVVENGVEIRDLDPSRASKEAARALGGELPGRPLVVTLASLHQRKGLDCLLDAAARVAERIPSARFVIAGEGPERGRLEEQRGKLGLDEAVLLPGPVLAVRDLLASADLFVLSSREEGISNALLEAHAEGVPAVVTDVGGNGRVVADGETGLVVPPGSPQALAGAILTVLEDADRCREMGRAARDRIGQSFTLDRMVRKMSEYYESVLERRPAQA
jgi:glycosyltransferase involved in cell wall biosynthesis